jgi:hypothetical protein
MIIYDLQCEHNHKFEGWFKSREEYDRENRAQRLSCPLCGNSQITLLPAGGHVSVKERTSNHDNQKEKVRAFSEYVEKNFDNVGAGFAEEALKMHFEEIDHRNILGTMTDGEEKELQEEGVEYIKVPVKKFSS